MKIRFETTIDDVMAFNRFHMANSPTWRRQVWTQSLIIPGVFALLFFFLFFVSDVGQAINVVMWPTAIMLVIVSIGSVVFVRWFMSSSLDSNTRKFLAEGRNRIMFGWREMELVNNRLVLKTELMESSLDLRAIEKIVRDENYTFVYIASVSAYMIPMTLYPEDEYREFVAHLIEAWENREAPRPAENRIDEREERPRPADVRITEKPL